MIFIELLKSIFIGIVQGITEWLPVSSTGHMILVDEFVNFKASEAFMEMFMVVIQLGSILSVLVLYFHKLNPFSRKKTTAEKKNTVSLWLKVLVGVIPAGVIGVLLDDWFDEHFYNFVVVAIALIVYGVVFIILERMRVKKGEQPRVETVDDITYKDALAIGCVQVLSLIPGTSRSGSTILGGILRRVSRVAASEFSFFMAIPIMLGASGVKVLKFVLDANTITSTELLILAVGVVVAFFVSLVSIKFLIDFVKRHSFECFGWYRIILGAIVLLYYFVK